MKHFVKICRDIYSKILFELLNRIEKTENIKPIVKRKIRLRINDIRRLFIYYNNDDVISYINQIRTVEEEIYQLMAIQVNDEYEKQYIKIKPFIKKNEDVKSYLVDNGIFDDMIRDEYDYFCKFTHAGEMQDWVLFMSKNGKYKRIINDFLSCCISIISINLIDSLSYLLDIENINIANMVCVSHVFLCLILIKDNIELFKEYEENLEYNFKEANIELLGKLSKTMIESIDESKKFKYIVSKDEINNLNAKINDEIKEYNVRKLDFEYIMKNILNISQNINKANITEDELKAKLNNYIMDSEKYKNIKYPHKQ